MTLELQLTSGSAETFSASSTVDFSMMVTSSSVNEAGAAAFAGEAGVVSGCVLGAFWVSYKICHLLWKSQNRATKKQETQRYDRTCNGNIDNFVRFFQNANLKRINCAH